VIVALLLACSPNYTIAVDTGGGDLDEDTAAAEDSAAEVDDAYWNGARLVIEAPTSGAFLPYGDTADFRAVVLDAEGNETGFTDIRWSSDVDAAWAPVGGALQDGALDVGTHALTATAELPNGDRLAYTVGGVLVQSAYAGIYVGDLSVVLSGDYNGQTISAGCSGGTTLTVDAYGETISGESGCLLSLFGYDIDSAYDFDLSNDTGVVTGDSAVDLGFVEYPFDTTGTLSEDGELSASFGELVYGYLDVQGSIAATRITRDLSGATE
jgi:hypothetical protein